MVGGKEVWERVGSAGSVMAERCGDGDWCKPPLPVLPKRPPANTSLETDLGGMDSSYIIPWFN